MSFVTPGPDKFILDPWTPLSHKTAIGDTQFGLPTGATALWVGPHARRLAAYRVLQAYIDNVSRHFKPTGDAAERREHREYGDAHLVVEVIRSGIMGDDQEITVPAAGDEDVVTAKRNSLSNRAARAGRSRRRRLAAAPTPEVEPSIDDENTESPEERAREAAEEQARAEAAAREDWLRAWSDDENFPLKIIETERFSVGLGDGVYVLSWSTKKNRTRLTSYDPGFYFPALNDADDEFPERVHLCWEVVQDDEGDYVQVDPLMPNPPSVGRTGAPRRIRRITYELDTIADGGERVYPWAEPDEPASNMTCYMTDAIWELSQNATIDNFAASLPGNRPVQFMRNEDGQDIDRLDLAIDFIPVVHIPNTAPGGQHFGQSSLLHIAQLLDDIQNADSDHAAASGLTGTPPIAVSGVISKSDTDTLSYGPGQVFTLGIDGKMDVVDTSHSLEALAGYIQFTLQRLATNARIPEALLGRIRGTLPSGIALALSFGPLQALVQEARLVRAPKYQLLLKFVQRFAMAGGALEPGIVEDAELVFGSYLPVDKAAAVDQVVRLLGAKAISRQTGIELLVEAGFTIGDAVAEVEAIEHEDFTGAVTLLDATGREELVESYLDVPARANEPAAAPATGRPGVTLRFPNAGGAGGGTVPPSEPPPSAPPGAPGDNVKPDSQAANRGPGGNPTR